DPLRGADAAAALQRVRGAHAFGRPRGAATARRQAAAGGRAGRRGVPAARRRAAAGVYRAEPARGDRSPGGGAGRAVIAETRTLVGRGRTVEPLLSELSVAGAPGHELP